MAEIIQRINRIQCIQNITKDLEGTLIFPRENKTPETYCEDREYPTDPEIESIILRALEDAKSECISLGINVKEQYWKNMCVFNQNFENIEETEEDNTIDEQFCQNESLAETNCDELSDKERELIHDVDILAEELSNANNDSIPDDEMSKLSSNELKNFGEFLDIKDVSCRGSTSRKTDNSFLSVSVNGKEITIRKSTLCWLLDSNTKISSDRLMRVRVPSSVLSKQTDKKIHVDLEKYYAVSYPETWYIGRVVRIIPSDETDNEPHNELDSPLQSMYEIKFLQANLSEFTWPKNDDIQEVDEKYIFFGPINMIGSGRMTISEGDRSSILHKYKCEKKKFK